MRIETIHRYPVKGLSPEPMERVDLRPGDGLPEDRRFAFAQASSRFDPAAPEWMPKANFACLMANARIARVRSAYDAATGRLLLSAPDTSPVEADLRTPEGRDRAEAWLTAYMGEEARGRLRLAEAPGHAFTDIPAKAVSLVGLASVAALGERIGLWLDPVRFRANVLFSGAEPFAELDWVGRELRIGGTRLRVFKRTKRCAATEVNPETAQRDARPPAALREHYGHADLGIYAEVLEGGPVALGDRMELA
ncbi:MAG TPA: MOSC domain-containing protein [Acetobacteraceae bacterium]|nr:MOSC domain-containing protein [Acetobacteraceae bacterium]